MAPFLCLMTIHDIGLNLVLNLAFARIAQLLLV